MAPNPAPTSQVERSMAISPPVKGWNTRDPKSNMDPEYAVELENFFPGNGVVELRRGTRVWSTSSAGSDGNYVVNLATFGTSNIIGNRSGGIMYSYDSSGNRTDISGGAASITESATFVNFSGRIFFKNPSIAFDVYHWTGTGNIALSGFTGPSGDDKALTGVFSFKGRLYFLGFTTSVWYGGVGAITGALTQFDVGSILINGGKLLFCGPYSPNSANLRQEYFVIISSTGEVLMYSGDYPDSASWNLVGQYFVGAPMGRLSFIRTDNDILIITAQGLVSLNNVVGGAVGDDRYLSNLIQSVYKELLETVVSLSAQELVSGIYYPKGNYIAISLVTELSADARFTQLVLNLINGAWTKFTGHVGFRWTIFQDRLFYGSNYDRIMEADVGYYDEDPADESIVARTIKCRHAFNYFGDPTKRKQFVAAIPTTYQSEGLSITANVDVDYTDDTATSTETDTSKGTSYQLYQPRLALSASSGNAASFRIDGTVTTKRFTLEATKMIWNEGGIE